MCAARFDHVECVKLALDAGADVNTQNHQCYTPLMEAARAGSVWCVTKLLSSKAQMNNFTRNSSREDDNVLNALELCLRADRTNEKVAMLLYAAGETVDKTKGTVLYHLKELGMRTPDGAFLRASKRQEPILFGQRGRQELHMIN